MARYGLAFLLAVLCASPAPVASAAQRGGGQGHPTLGGSGGNPTRFIPAPPVTPPSPPSINHPSFPTGGLNRPAPPSINRPSFPTGGLNRPAFPLTGTPGFGPVPRSPFDTRPGTYTRRSRGVQPYGLPLGYGYGIPSYADTTTGYQPSAQEPDFVDGTLLLDVTPRTALVFVDSAYVGTVGDLLFDGVSLSRGRHWVEIEAPDYEKKLVEVNITPDRPLRYTVELAPARRAALTVIPPRPPQTMYAIPGCYGGNRPPVAANLPAGCDIANVRVIRPQPQRAN